MGKEITVSKEKKGEMEDDTKNDNGKEKMESNDNKVVSKPELSPPNLPEKKKKKTKVKAEDVIAKALEEISQMENKKHLKESNKKKHPEVKEQQSVDEMKSKVTSVENEVASVEMESSLIEERSRSESPVTEVMPEQGLSETITESDIAVVHLGASKTIKVQTIEKETHEKDFTMPKVEAQKVRGADTKQKNKKMETSNTLSKDINVPPKPVGHEIWPSEKPSMEFTFINPQFSDTSRPTS